MALQISLSSPHIRSGKTASHPFICSSDNFRCVTGDLSSRISLNINKRTTEKKKKNTSFIVRSSLDTAGPVVGQVTEVCKDTFWPLVNAAGDKPVVVDMYTQWCGPCKVMAPKFQELSQKYLDVVFLKLDCNQDNRPLAKELGIKVVPTFKILKNSKIIKEVKGAKFDDLVLAIDTVRSS